MSAITVFASRYGDAPSQSGDLWMPRSNKAPVVCLLHGGFWRVPHGREQWQAVAQDLVQRGHAVWNLGYRRIGEPGGGWPGTFEDVAAGIAHLVTLARAAPIHLGDIAIAGHSAGGHLALWAAENTAVRIRAVAALAPVADLARAWEPGLGEDAVAALLGGSPSERPDAYAAASPGRKRAAGVRQAIFHGTDDRAVPIELSRNYVRDARAAGSDIEFHPLADAGHMDFLDPASHAHAAWCDWLSAAR